MDLPKTKLITKASKHISSRKASSSDPESSLHRHSNLKSQIKLYQNNIVQHAQSEHSRFNPPAQTLKLQPSSDEVKVQNCEDCINVQNCQDQAKVQNFDVCEEIQKHEKQWAQSLKETIQKINRILQMKPSIVPEVKPSVPAEKPQKKYRAHFVHYLTIIYHCNFDFLNVQEPQKLKLLLQHVYGKWNSYITEQIMKQILDYHSRMLQEHQTIPNIINFMLQDLKVTQEEYNVSRKRSVKKFIVDTKILKVKSFENSNVLKNTSI